MNKTSKFAKNCLEMNHLLNPNQYLIGIDTSWTSNFHPGFSSDSNNNITFVESTSSQVKSNPSLFKNK